MKKVSILVAILVVVVSVVACNKRNDSGTKQPMNVGHFAERNGSATQIWWQAWHRCEKDPKNCGPETVITAKRLRLEALTNAIDNGPTAIGNFFSNTNNWDVFPQNYPSTAQMSSLASGDYEILIDINNGIHYFLCGPEGTVSNEGPEFVVQVEYQD